MNLTEKTFISYDHKDAQSIELKTKYATQRGLAGMSVFESYAHCLFC